MNLQISTIGPLVALLCLILSYGKAQDYDLSFQALPFSEGNQPLENAVAGGINSGQFSEIDLDLDGELDLVVFDRTSNKLSTYIWEGDSYIYAPHFEYLFPGNLINWVLLRDYDGDGHPDLFTSTNLGIKVYRNESIVNGDLSWRLIADPIITQGNTLINLFVNSSDLPAIHDVDGDGDLDIMVFNFATGGFIEFHENQSIDDFGHRDSLQYLRVTREWGDFQECFCGQFAFGGDPCSGTNRLLHISGKALTVQDINGDALPDIFFGEEECGDLFSLLNQGSLETAVFQSADIPFPELSDRHFFPATYFIDINHNGTQELVTSPNDRSNEFDLHDFSNSVFAFEQLGDKFIDLEDRFLQKTMIDVGENSYPALGDVDNDDDLDLLIGNRGSILSNDKPGTISYYENIGSSLSPNFSLATTDFLEISNLDWSYVKPKLKDLDGDRMPELIFTGLKGGENRLFIIKGSATGFELSNSTEHQVPMNELDQYELYDVNRDGSIDLLVGTSGGRLDLYLNNGPSMTPVFVLEEQSYLGINISPFRTNLSIAVADNNDAADLLLYDDSGELNIIPGFNDNSIQSEMLIESIEQPSRLGRQGSLTLGRLSANNLINVIVGSVQGGIHSLAYENGNGAIDPELWEVNVYPNPARSGTKLISSRSAIGRLVSLSGKTLINGIEVEANAIKPIDLSNLSQGLYILQLTDVQGDHQQQRILVYE